MPEAGDNVKVNLDALFHATTEDRVLPSITEDGDIWWRYLDDDSEGGWCLYTYTYDEPADEENDLDAMIEDLKEEHGLAPSIFDGDEAGIIWVTDEGNVLLRASANEDGPYVDGGLYSSDFLLTKEEFEQVCE